MITPDRLRPYRTAAPDYAQTVRLKSDLSALRQRRQPYFLTFSELDAIFRWKLDRQYGRQAALRSLSSPAMYESATRACFAVVLPDIDEEARLRLAVLIGLRGVGVPVASAILALVESQRYCVIDFRGWAVLFESDQRQFSIEDYLHYSAEIRRLAEKLGWSVQETDMAVWHLYDVHHEKAAS